MCSLHYNKHWAQYGADNPREVKRLYRSRALEAFNSAMEIETDDCLLWPLSVRSGGYGQLVIESKHYGVHRLALERKVGMAPREKPHVLHSCDNPRCFNYRHLRYGTNMENIQDRVDRGRSLRGENHRTSKLTEQQVVTIRDMVREKKYSQSNIGKRFGVTQSLVWCIGNGKRWEWLK